MYTFELALRLRSERASVSAHPVVAAAAQGPRFSYEGDQPAFYHASISIFSLFLHFVSFPGSHLSLHARVGGCFVTEQLRDSLPLATGQRLPYLSVFFMLSLTGIV